MRVPVVIICITASSGNKNMVLCSLNTPDSQLALLLPTNARAHPFSILANPFFSRQTFTLDGLMGIIEPELPQGAALLRWHASTGICRTVNTVGSRDSSPHHI